MLVEPSKYLKQKIQIELNRVKNPNWPAANQLAEIWTRTTDCEQIQLGGQGGTRTRGLWIASQTLLPLSQLPPTMDAAEL